MIRFVDVELRRGGLALMRQVSFQLHAGWRVGLTGANGSGKSTLLAALQGILTADAGELSIPPGWVIAHLPQEVEASEQLALEYVLDGDSPLRQLQQRLAVLGNDLEAENNGDEQARLYAEIDAIDGWSAEARAQQLLAGLGFDPGDAKRPVGDFSGGWRMRLGLARTLMQRSDLLLLDEPTNHLDFETIIWLEGWLAQYRGTLIVIAHDRRFLDAVVDHVLHIEHGGAQLYTGGYSAAELQRLERRAQSEAMARRITEERSRLESFVNRFRAKATKARQAQSRLRRLEKLEDVEVLRAAVRTHLNLPAPARLPDPLLRLEKAAVRSSERQRLYPTTLQLRPDDRVGILGPNGAGKSTLLSALAGVLPLTDGTRAIDPDLAVGYFAQHQREQLDETASPLLHLQRMALRETEQTLRNRLGALGFSGSRADQPVATCSGGERVRLVFAMLVSRAPAVLLLDEPTNHLDLEMRETLAEALESYPGALVIVSHDRELLDRVCDRFWRVDQGRVEEFPGDLAEYMQQIRLDSAAGVSAGGVTNAATADAAVSQRDRRRRAAEQRQVLQPLQKRANDLERECARIEERLRTIEVALADSALYTEDATQRLQDLLRQQADLRGQLADRENDWMAALEALEVARSEDPSRRKAAEVS